MDDFIRFLLLASLFFLLWAVYLVIVSWFIKPRLARRRADFDGAKAADRRIIRFALLVLVAVWLSRLATGLFRYEHPELFVGDEEELLPKIAPGDQLINSLLHAFMSFSMDEAFTEYLLVGQKMVSELSGHAHWTEVCYSVYAAMLNCFAPIAGGAIILDILSEIFPRVRFWFAKQRFLKEMFFFTSLNEQSLSLAKSIVTSKNYSHGLIVFTDVYADAENEESSELLLRAKTLGAICLKDDLLHISIERIVKRKTTRIFLSDKKENDNLETLARLLAWKKRSIFKNLEIYVFSSDRNNDNNKVSFLEDEVFYINNRIITEWKERDSEEIKKLKEKSDKKIARKKYGDAEKEEAEKKAKERLAKKISKKYPLPRVTPVNGVRNMAQNLFRDIPLFEGLYGKQGEKKTIRLTVFGIGVIGTEIFLNAYWMGQMLDTVLDITIVSKEAAEEFKNKINFLNPEILNTLYFETDGKKEAAPERDSLLTVKPGETAEPYAYVRYIQKNVMLSEFLKDMRSNTEEYGIIHSDYFVVALGSDEDNFTVADKLRQIIGYSHLNDKEAGNRKAIISYVIYNSELCATLNKKCRHDNVCHAEEQSEFDIYMHAFGSMDEVYSMKNVMFDGIRKEAEQTGVNYQRKSGSRDDAYSLDSIKRWKSISTQYYVYRSDIARRLHLEYKVFSAGYLEPSLFRTVSDRDYQKNLDEARERYRGYLDSVEKEGDFTLLHQLAWLEHRRWNAFMRVCGFFHADDFSRYMKLNNDLHEADEHKFLMLKLHPCIVECGKDGIHAKLDDAGKVIIKEPLRMDEMEDRLDLATVKRNELKGNPQTAENDFKRWDYPECDSF